MKRTLRALIKTGKSTEWKEFPEEGIPETFKVKAKGKNETLLDIVILGDPVKRIEISGFKEIGDSHSSISINGNAHIEELTIKNVKRVNPFFFSNAHVNKISMREAECNELPMGCFSDCTNLKSIEIPEGTLAIGESAFKNTPNLQDISGINNVIRIQKSAFENSIKELNLSSCIDLELIDKPFGNNSGQLKLPFDCIAAIEGDFDIKGSVLMFRAAPMGPSNPVLVAGSTFVLTGKMWLPRADIEDAIYKRGGFVVNKIGPGVNYLVSTRTDTTKYKDAVKRGITVISESDLQKALD